MNLAQTVTVTELMNKFMILSIEESCIFEDNGTYLLFIDDGSEVCLYHDGYWVFWKGARAA